jgi:nucleoside-diphosphate-sugar epimerase
VRVVVTGAQGFVGRYLVAHHARRGHAVAAFDVAAPAERLPGVTYLAGDVREPASYAPALAGADLIVHLASAHLQVGPPESFFWSVNVESLRPLLEAARDAGVKHFVHTSSVGVHGSLERVPGNEDAPIRPENLYERTKAAGEERVRQFLPDAAEMGVTIVRPAWIYGPGDARTEKILRAIGKGRFVMFGSGANWRHPIHIDDYLAGMDAVTLNPASYGRTYILAGPEPVTARGLVAAAERATGGRVRLRVPLAFGYAAGLAAERAGKLLRMSPPISRRTLAFFTNQNWFDTSRARRELGFAPAIGLDDGFRRTWAAIRPGDISARNGSTSGVAT